LPLVKIAMIHTVACFIIILKLIYLSKPSDV
jgi:hypothetical protein